MEAESLNPDGGHLPLYFEAEACHNGRKAERLETQVGPGGDARRASEQAASQDPGRASRTAVIARERAAGRVEMAGGRCFLTEEGMAFLDGVTALFVKCDF